MELSLDNMLAAHDLGPHMFPDLIVYQGWCSVETHRCSLLAADRQYLFWLVGACYTGVLHFVKIALSPSVLHHTDLVAPWAPKACSASGPLHLLLLLCMHFLAEMLVLHVISLAPFFPSMHDSVQISHQADFLWPLIDGKVILPITLSPYLASFFFMVCVIPRSLQSLQRYFKDILIYLLFSHDSSIRTWNPWQ